MEDPKKESEGLIDLIQYHHKDKTQIDCLDHGFVRIVDAMPRVAHSMDLPTADYAITRAARVSYGKGTKTIKEDRGLIRYLLRHMHTSPLEHVEFSFHCKMPIFIARQWIRHRTANVNEYSGRYSIMSDQFYVPEHDRIQNQSKTNKQGTDEEGQLSMSTQLIMQRRLEEEQQSSWKHYTQYLEVDMARELARINLPVSNYTEWYWKIDLLNLFKFLKLRLDSHAQYEIQVFAQAMYDLIKPIVPIACEAFEDYWQESESFSKQEMQMLRSLVSPEELAQMIDIDKTLSKGERSEFSKKLT